MSQDQSLTVTKRSLKDTAIEEPHPKGAVVLGAVFGFVVGGASAWVLATYTPYAAFIGSNGLYGWGILALLPVLFALAFGMVAYGRAMARAFEDARARFKTALEVNSAKDEFTSMVLHHLRTPLAGMRWMISEVIRGKRYPADVKEIFDTLYDTDKRALAAVSHLLDVSKASMERIEYTIDEVSVHDLQDIVRKNVEMYQEQFKEKGIDLKKNFTRKIEGGVKIDKEKIATVVGTLIENAIHYTPQGGTVTVTTEQDGKEYTIAIADTGIGVPEDDKSRIFLQFYRAENAIKKNPEGFGVGLYLIKLFVENQKGTVDMQSEEGKGSTFTVHIPLYSISTPAPTEASAST